MIIVSVSLGSSVSVATAAAYCCCCCCRRIGIICAPQSHSLHQQNRKHIHTRIAVCRVVAVHAYAYSESESIYIVLSGVANDGVDIVVVDVDDDLIESDAVSSSSSS